MIEREIKQLITHEMYLRLVALADNPPVLQTNYYFDTKNFALNKNGITMRLRNKQNKWELTVKMHMGKTADTLTSREITIPIDESTAQKYIKSIDASVLNNILADNGHSFRAESLYNTGSLQTSRTLVPLPGLDVILEVDESRYLGITDYEIECELDDVSKADKVTDTLKGMGVYPISQIKGKYSRFLAQFNTKGACK